MKKLMQRRGYMKGLLLGFLLQFVTSLYADNLYVGVQGGWQNLKIKGSLEVLASPNTPVYPFNVKADNALVDFYVGVQKKISVRTIIAAEADAMLPFAKTTTEHSGTVGHQKLSYNVGGSLKAGVFYIKNGYVYARGGLGVGGFKQDASTSLGAFAKVNGDNIFYYRLGLGVNQQFSLHWAAQLEYDYYHYSPFRLHQKSIMPAHAIVSTNLRPTMNVVMGGLSYIF